MAKNNISLEKLSKYNIKESKKIYKEAFPHRERMPLWFMMRKVKKNQIELFVIKNDNEVCGIAFFMLYADMVLLAFFAVEQKHRSSGIGSATIKLISQHYEGKRLFLEVESVYDKADNNEQRIKRIKFYLRNGLIKTGINIELFKINMELLSFGKDITYDEYFSLYSELVGKRFAGKNIFKRT